MPDLISSLPELVAQFVSGTPANAVTSIAAGLADDSISLDSSSVGIASLRNVSPQVAQRSALMFRQLPDGISPSGVATLLATANEVRKIAQLDREKIDIAWTGPDADGPYVRPTEAVLDEMLQGVRESGEVLIVGYALIVAHESPMLKVVEQLASASRSGALITVVLHNDGAEANRKNLLEHWDMNVRKPDIYTWNPPPDHPYTKLHAKAIVVDRLDLLVTSANLTFHGLRLNLELGLRVRGPEANAVALRFDELIASGALTRW